MEGIGFTESAVSQKIAKMLRNYGGKVGTQDGATNGQLTPANTPTKAGRKRKSKDNKSPKSASKRVKAAVKEE
ncbi:MAG: hypothetical protein Q9219_007552 [cf. Caloplaca sp. 3 TL-2023]